MAAANTSPSASPRSPTIVSRSRSSPPARSCRDCRCSTRCRTAPSRWATPRSITIGARTRRSPSAPRCRSVSTLARCRHGCSSATGTDLLNDLLKSYNCIGVGGQHRRADGRLVPQGDQDRRGSEGPQVPGRRFRRQHPVPGSARCRSSSPPATSILRSKRAPSMPPNGSAPTTTRSSASTRWRRTTTIRAGGKVAARPTTSSIWPSGTSCRSRTRPRSRPRPAMPGVGSSAGTTTPIRRR